MLDLPHNAYLAAGATLAVYQDLAPRIGAHVTIMEGARVVGDVTLGTGVGIWYNAVIRGDVHVITVGEDTNIQDNAVLHVTGGVSPLHVGARVTVGHAARLHGCTIADECLVGIGAVVLDNAVLEPHSVVAAGAVVPPRMTVPSGQLVAGVPARVIRPLRQEEIADLPASAARYRRYAELHRR